MARILSEGLSVSCDLSTSARACVRALEPYQPGKPIEELERELGIRNAIKLASNENPWGPSPRARAALAALDPAAWSRYPDGAATLLRRTLADKLGVSASAVTVGNGSNDLLELAARAFVGPNDRVVYSRHAFAVYAIATQAVGGHHVEVPARDFGHDLPAMAKAAADAKLVFVANPNNPTGTCEGADALAAFLTAVPGHVPVVVDEAYREYVARPDYPDTVSWLKRFPNLIITRTFSKIYGLAGLRVGYAISNPIIADLLNRLRQPFNVNLAAQVAARAALEDDVFVARCHKENLAGLAVLSEGLARLGHTVLPSAANFLTFEVEHAADVYQALLREGVIVRPIANYGMPNHLRVTVGMPEENTRFLAALERIMSRSEAAV
ncbi:MAG: histidinol-phosphate transaminase [Acidiferrobacteraceae bacterium]